MIKKIEELLINADPASGIIVEDGYMVRFYTVNDKCVINKITHKDEKDSAELIRSHIARLKKIKLDPCYRILHEASYEHLDQELVRNGFGVIDRGVVMALRIENMERELFAFANFYEQGIFSDEGLSDEWIEDYKELLQMDRAYGDIFEKNLKASLEEKMSFGLLQNDRLIAMGYATFIGDYLIINDITVEERYRNLDYGKKLLKAMLIKGLNKGCKVALCDIREEQQIALRLLAKEGFERAYSYQYRGKSI